MPKRPRAGRATRRLASASGVRIVLSTAPPRAAASLARRLVSSGLAACVNVVPGVSSVYRWKGKVLRARESLLVIKTPRRAVRRLLAALVAAHPYEVPEALVLAPSAGLKSYLDWIVGSSPAGKA